MKVKTADRIGHVKEYYFSKKLREIAAMRAQGVDIINLGIGSPDGMPDSSVLKSLNSAVLQQGVHGYQSYVGLPDLRRAQAEWYARHFGVDTDPDREILPLIGSKEGIMHISMTYLQAGDEVLVPDPGYPSYAAAARLAGATVRKYDLKADRQWLPDLTSLANEDLDRVKIMWVSYPHMPTGARASLEFLGELVNFCRSRNILLCHDNPYVFVLNDKPHSLFQIEGAREVALELTSLSKSYNMAGWRIGFLSGAAERISEVLKFKSNMDSGMFKPIQIAAIQALSLGQEWFDSVNEVYRKRRVLAGQILETLGCSFDPKQVGMFLWARIPDDVADGYTLSDRVLEENHVFITPGNIFGKNGSKYVRMSLCSNMKILQKAYTRCQSPIKTTDHV